MFTALTSIGVLLILALIGSLILLRRGSFKTENKNSKRLYIVTGALQAAHLLSYLTGALEKVSQFHVYLAFGLCTLVSVLCFLLSVWMLLPLSKCRHGVKYLFLFVSVLQVAGTICIFLLPEAGIPPLIHF